MRILSVTIVTLLITATSTFAAEPTTIEELKSHFTTVENKSETFSADYSMTMEIPTAQAAAAGDMAMQGKLKAKGENMKMDMTMNMSVAALGQDMEMNMKMLLKEKIMYMLIHVDGMIQAIKMDMGIMSELADALGVPEEALNSGNMAMIKNPAKMLEQYGNMYDLTFKGKESVEGEEVYVVSAKLKQEILENFMNVPLLQTQSEMYKFEQVVYLGASDGIMRKMDMGYGVMTLTNINTNADISDSDMELTPPEGTDFMDMTPMLESAYSGMLPE